ncbi:MAG: hypothetical protein L0271_00220 [Gemmatimonadetes bacterium]|nr:hypothetical protein [Gemmatimonadota bacterium]
MNPSDPGAVLVRREDQAPGSGPGGIFYDPYTGRIAQRGVTTPGLYRDTKAGGLPISVRGFLGATAANGGWKLVQVDRPMVTMPVDILASQLLYAPDMIPTDEQACFRSFGHGICHLWHPGDWYIRAQNAGVNYQVMLVDASDPAFVAFLIGVGGTNGHTSSVTTVAAAASTTIVAANRWRRSLILQNIHATIGAFIKVDGTATRTSGIYLAPGGSFTMEGNTLSLKGVNGISEDTVTDTLVSAMDMY